ncbi:aspartate-rich protein 1-like isoform X4 [Macaca nemestrina]|uniref:aspartate-rich protein 1-like isoform X4 n=1 Tax=Macaca nemestrina TaxID=9545 RepID=UPI0039B86795
MFSVASFTTGNNWKERKCPSAREWIDPCGLWIQWSAAQLYKEKKLWIQATGGMDFKTLHWCRGKVAPCYESVIYEAVAAATSESTSVEPGKLDVGATEGHELQHIGNQKMPTGPPEDHLSLKSLPPSEEDNDDAQALPARPEDGLFLRCSPQCKDEDDDDDDGDVDCDDDDDDDDDVQIRSWKGKDLMLESISDVETHPGLGRGPEDMRLMHRSKRRFSPSLMHTKVVGCSPCPWRCAADRCSSRGLAS